jgi:GxxExxY protein
MENICKEVHETLGIGFRETIYQEALAVELRLHGHHVNTECVIPVKYKGSYVGNIRCDIIINHDTIIECKAISKITEKERNQLRQYLRTTDLKKGYLVNFGTTLEVNAI